MDYKKIYYDLCKYGKDVSVRDRLILRDPCDIRLKCEHIYTENHHIVPKHEGGSDDESNLVRLLPEEHYLAHLLRYKAYNSKNDFIAVRFILNGMRSSRYKDSDIFNDAYLQQISVSKRVALFKQCVYNFRKNHEWHTEVGRLSISNSRVGKMPCVDAITREGVGVHRVDHPKVLSGEWIHHSTGYVSAIDDCTGEVVRVTVDDYRSNPYLSSIRGDVNGCKNPNYKDMTEERKQRLFDLIPECIVDGEYLQVKLLLSKMKNEFVEFKKLSNVWLINNFGSYNNLIDEYNQKYSTQYKYNAHYRSKYMRNKLKNSNSSYIWVTDGSTNSRILDREYDEFIERNIKFKRGRTINGN